VLLHYHVKRKRLKMTRIVQKLKSCHLKISHAFNQLLTLWQNLLKMCSFNLHTSSQLRVPLVNCRESSNLSAGQCCHTQSLWHCLVSGAGNIPSDQIVHTTTQWTTVSVALPNSMTTSPVCSKCQWTEAASIRRLV